MARSHYLQPGWLPVWIMLLCMAMSVSAQPLQLCHDAAVDPNYEPTVTVGAHTVTGIHNVMTVKTLTQLGIAFQLHSMPWLRCLNAVNRGDIDGAIGVGWTEKRARTMHFPMLANGDPDPAQALFSVDYFVYTLKHGDLQWDGQRFSQIRFGIAAPRGFVVAKILDKMGVYNPIDAEIDAAIMLTVNRRIDGFVQSRVVAEGQLAQSKDAALIQQLTPVFFSQPLYLAFSQLAMQRNPEQLRRIWQTFQAVQPQIPGAPVPEL